MKTNAFTDNDSRKLRALGALRLIIQGLALCSGALLAAGTAQGQIFVLQGATSGTIGEYTTSGATINASLATGVPGAFYSFAGDAQGQLFVGHYSTVAEYNTSGALVSSSFLSPSTVYPNDLACDGNGNLFVAETSQGSVSEWTTAGAPVSGFGISGAANPAGMSFDGSGHIFVVGSFRVSEYTTSGMMVNYLLISTSATPSAIACDGPNLYVAVGSTVMKYSTAGVLVSGWLISGLGYCAALACDGNGHLYVADSGKGVIGMYNTTSGAAISASLISGLTNLDGMVVIPQINPAPIAASQSVVVQANSSANAITLAGTDLNPSPFPLQYTVRTLPTIGTLYDSGTPIGPASVP